MPSQPIESGWDFSSVINLIDSDTQDVSTPLRIESRSPAPAFAFSDKEGGVSLGNFSKLFENLGISNEAPTLLPPLPPLDPDSELSSSSADVLPQRSLPDTKLLVKSKAAPQGTAVKTEPRQNFERTVSTPNVKFSIKPKKAAPAAPVILRVPLLDDAPISPTKKQRKKARRQAEKEQEEQALAAEVHKEKQKIMQEFEAVAEVAAKFQDVHATPSKPHRARSNVSVKITSSTPAQTPVTQKPAVAILPRPVVETPVVVPLQPPTTPSRAQRPGVSQQLSHIAQPVTPQPSHTVGRPAQDTTLSTHAPFQYGNAQGLIPRTVQPATIPRKARPDAVSRKSAPAVASTPMPLAVAPPVFATPTSRPGTASLTLRSQVERHLNLFHKLIGYFPEDVKWVVAPKQLVNENTMAEGLHIFVDVSNIMIGFRDQLRSRGIFQPYDMSFDSLALLMERRRPVAKRILAGSHREANPLAHMKKLVDTSKAVGYDNHVIEQVYISREPSDKKKFFDDVKKMGWHRATEKHSGSGSDSETSAPAAPKTPSAPKWVEQGVDELLHLKMCQSIIDTDTPSTIVLATGDGNVAEMSDGFLAHVERALKNGWKVELVSWRQQTNGGYKNKKFRAKWGDQFRIIELDDFLEDLIDTP